MCVRGAAQPPNHSSQSQSLYLGVSAGGRVTAKRRSAEAPIGPHRLADELASGHPLHRPRGLFILTMRPGGIAGIWTRNRYKRSESLLVPAKRAKLDQSD